MVRIATLDGDGRLTPAQAPTLPTLGATATGEALIEAESAAAARSAIGAAASAHAHPASEISDSTAAGRSLVTAADAAAQRTTLGLGGAAVLAVGTTAGTVAAGDDSRITGALAASDLDAAATALDGNAASALRVQQDARHSSTFVANAGTDPLNVPVPKPAGDARSGVWEYVHNGPAGYLYHLMCGASMASGAALIGLGIDNDGVGLFVNNKAHGIGVKIVNASTITDASSFGMEFSQNSTLAPAFYMAQAAGAAEAAQWVAATGASTGQNFLRYLANGSEKGAWKADTGNIHWRADIVAHTGGVIRAVSSELTTDRNETQVKNASIQFASYSGSTGQFWHKRLSHSAQSLLFQTSDLTAGGPDATPTWVTGFEIKNVSGATRLGFFGATPAAKPTGVTVDAAGIHAALVTLGLIAA